jgi:protein-S-isoprenylcysteine O-methyltransferase Ste14
MLGGPFTGLVAIQPGHALVTSGVYGVMRHPSYLGLLVGTLGWGLTFRSGVGVGARQVLIARIRAEENLLRMHIGGPWRLIPGPTRRSIASNLRSPKPTVVMLL